MPQYDGIHIDSGNPAFDALLKRMADVHKTKNCDYAHPERGDFYSNFREVERLGISSWRGILVRMCDKWSRICNLAQRGNAAVKDETIEDTLVDMANYALLCILVRHASGEEG